MNLRPFFLIFFLLSFKSYAIDFIRPADNEEIAAASNYTLEWESVQGASYSIFYSEDQGKTFIPIADNLTQNTYEWLVPELLSPDITLYCEAHIFLPPQLLYTEDLLGGRINSVSYDASGKRVVISNINNDIIVFDDNFSKIASYSMPELGTLFDSQFIRKDSILFSAGDKLYTLDLHSGSYFEFASGYFQPGSNIEKALFNEIRNEVAAASYDGSVRIFDLATETEKLSFSSVDGHEFYSLTYSDDATMLAAGDRAGRVYIHNFNTTELKVIEPKSSNIVWNIARAIDIDGGNSRILVAYADGSNTVYDMSDLTVLESVNGHSGQIRAAEYHPKEDFYLTASMDKTFIQWYNQNFIHNPVETNLIVSDACYSETGDTIAIVSYEGVVQFWENFVRSRDTANANFRLKYDLIISFEDYKVEINDKLQIAPEIKFNYANKFLLDGDSLTITVDFPSKSLWPTQDLNMERVNDRFIFTQNFNNHSFDGLNYLVLYNSEERKASLKIKDATIMNELIRLTTEDGSIEIADECLYDFSETQLADRAEVIITPFPASETISISCKLPENQVHRYRILDLSGRNIAGLEGIIDCETENKEINISKISNGLYTFEIISKTGKKYHKQILIQK